MKTVIVIPARFASTRFPAKPLAKIHGYTLLYRVWSLAKTVHRVSAVVIATDHVSIAEHAENFGAQVVMTNPCENGSERVLQALDQLDWKPEYIINLQGDAVLIPPWVIQNLVDTVQSSKHISVATLATRLSPVQYQAMAQARNGGTTVVFNQRYEALYFSKACIPFVRNMPEVFVPVYQHIGLYAYRYASLQHYVNLTPSPLEQAEGLEQLRFLEYGIPIRVVLADYQGRTHASIDYPSDIGHVEAIIQREGELLTL